MAKQINIAMASETSICNQALTWLGQNPMSSMDDKSKAAEWMRTNYPFLRDAVLEEVTWTFATDRQTSTTADKDGWGVMWSHPKPLNWISVMRVFGSVDSYGNGQDPDLNWRLEGGNILSQYDTVYLWGIMQISDTAKFSPMFNQALAARVAADAAIPLTQNSSLQKDMWALYVSKIEAAAARNGQQGGNDRINKGNMTRRRGSL